MPRIIAVAMDEAPRLIDDIVAVTSAWRPAKPRFSWHHMGRAVDFRTGLNLRDDFREMGQPDLDDLVYTRRPGAIWCEPPGENEAEAVYYSACAWADRIRARLGTEFDIVYGIDVGHWNHIHAEGMETRNRGR